MLNQSKKITQIKRVGHFPPDMKTEIYDQILWNQQCNEIVNQVFVEGKSVGTAKLSQSLSFNKLYNTHMQWVLLYHEFAVYYSTKICYISDY